ncbi:RNA polymerase beta subunit [Shewanella phage FishSpeaker]|nr:RNA polymerase beta subunit [Shewanella phage FishSpeaker]
MKPTRIKLLDPKTIFPPLINEVSSGDTFDRGTHNLHEEGLYSPTIFGRIGRKDRFSKEGFINTGAPILNPTYYKTIVGLNNGQNGLYAGILKGIVYAKWDAQKKDFIKSDIIEGRTGYSFFLEHLSEFAPELKDSHSRKQAIKLILENKDKALMKRFIVIPAGLRDIEHRPDGGVKEKEINKTYQRLIFRARSLQGINERDENDPVYDNSRASIGEIVNEIDHELFEMLNGKSGFIQSKVGTRGLVSSTRNVIVARQVSRTHLDEDDGKGINSTDIGLYQAMLMYNYACLHELINGWLSTIFTIGANVGKLVDTKTLTSEYVDLKPDTISKWTTVEGLNKLIYGFKNVHLRHKPIVVEGYYLGLVYDDGKEVKLLSDIGELPDGRDKKFVTPLTYFEMFYLICNQAIKQNLMQQTRYPIIGIGSTYPSYNNLVTGSENKPRNVLNEMWETEYRCLSYPEKSEHPVYYDAMSVDISRYANLDADNDGDFLVH